MTNPDLYLFCRKARQWENYTEKDIDFVMEGIFPASDKKIMKECILTWNKSFPISYMQCRARIKASSKQNYQSLPLIKKIIDGEEASLFEKNPQPGLYLFMDDDDVLSPALPEALLGNYNPEIDIYNFEAQMSGNRFTPTALGKLERELIRTPVKIALTKDLPLASGDAGTAVTHKIGSVTRLATLAFERNIVKHKLRKWVDANHLSDIHRPFVFLNWHPLSVTCFRRFYFPAHRPDWAKSLSLKEAFTFCMRRYIDNSLKEIEKIPQQTWYLPYWKNIVTLYQECL